MKTESNQELEVNAESYCHTFPALRGIQAGREFFVAMCPLKLLPRMFLFAGEEVPAELRAQRTLNKARIPEIARYLTDNPKEYVFSSITASLDTEVRFKPFGDIHSHMGNLYIPMKARFVINDGQHRRAAIEEALKERPELGDENISVVFFIDRDLKRSQQMFADLNKHAVRPTKSLGIFYDHRDPLSVLSKEIAETVIYFSGLTEMEKTTISNRSIKLFTLSSIYQATKRFLNKKRKGANQVSDEEKNFAIEFWAEVGKHIPEWRLAVEKKVACADLRREFIHAHGIALQSLAIACSDLIHAYPNDWTERLNKLSKVDWSRRNSKLWEGRAMIGGRVSKAHNNVILTSNVIKKVLGVPLTGEEEKTEEKFNAGNR